MKAESRVQEGRRAGEAKPDARAQMARYLEQQPQSKRKFDKVMKALELGGLALVAGYVAWAIYVSINWSVQREIAAVWLACPVILAVLLALVGIHAAGLGVFPPVIVLGGPQEFATGSKAVGTGIGFAVTVSLAGVFWGAFAYGIWAESWALLKPLSQIVGVVVGVGVVVVVISELRKRFFRS